MADDTDLTRPESPIFDAEQVTGIVYVIDLVGFSKITEAQIAESARRGTETVTQMVTDLFGKLMTELARRDIHFGGFAGDALIAWQVDIEAPLSPSDLERIAAEICNDVAPGLSCRTATAQGRFWTSKLLAQDHGRPLVWGPAVRQAFAELVYQSRDVGADTALPDSATRSATHILATASVTDRWTVIVCALTPTDCETTHPTDLVALLQRTRVICDAVNAEIDNIVQDDKGLLIVIVLPASRRQDTAQRDLLLDSLTSSRAPVARQVEVEADFGTVFRCHPEIAGQPVVITIGKPINQAAKALMQNVDSSGAAASTLLKQQAPVSNFMIGRETEIRRLSRVYQASRLTRQTATLTASAGIGKTTVIQTLISQIDAPFAMVEVTPGSRFAPFGCAQDLAEACHLPAATVFETDAQARFAKNLPHVIIIENWQWCDEDSKRLIRRLHNERQSGLLLVTSREPIDGLDAETHLHLSALDFEQSGMLLDTHAPRALSESVKRSIFDLTSGTPFWLVQAALHYSETSPQSQSLTPLSGLEGLLSARGRDLSDEATALWRLYCAWRLPLAFETARDLLTGFEFAIGLQHLGEITGLGWLVGDKTKGTAGLRPAHDILADWGNSDLPVTFEQTLHNAIARALGDAEASPSRIARHWQIAGEDAQASIWYDRAAQNADRAGAHDLTISHLSQSRRLSGAGGSGNDVHDLEYLAMMATANWGVGKLRQAKQMLIAFDDLAKDIPASRAKRAALRRAATIQSEIGQFAGNSNLMLSGMYRGWRNSRDDTGAYEVKARRQGFIYYALGLLKLPVTGRLNRAVEKAHAQGEYRSQTLLGCAAGTLHMTRCDWQKADAVLSSCYAAIAQTDDRQMLGVAQCLLGLCHLFQGDTPQAHEWFDRVSDTGKDHNHHVFKVWGAYAKAEAHMYAGELDDAKQLALKARALSKGLGDHQSASIIEGVLAQVYLASGDTRNAYRHARNAARFAAKLPPTNFSTLEGIAAPAQVGAELLRRDGANPGLDALIKSGRKALKSYANVFKIAQPRHHYVEALYAQARGDLNSATRQIQKARSASIELGMRYEQKLAVSALNAIQEKPDGAPAELH
ncbi:MAG: hypothetical protein AAF269_05070 [Pseudomonadota bacterium]